MLKYVDRGVSGLLILAALGHVFGSVAEYAFLTPELVWALSASTFAILAAAINLLRVSRPGDTALAWTCFGGSSAWLVIALAFAISINNILDPRADIHAVLALLLAGFSLRSAMGWNGASRSTIAAARA